MHYLDLPILRTRPTFETLHSACIELSSNTDDVDFEKTDKLDKGTRQWLAGSASNELDWVDEDRAEFLRTLAAKRLSQECGVTATSFRQRKLVLSENITVLLDEPGMSEDLLGKLTWGSSLVLAKRSVQQDPGSVADHRVIELGAGTGSVGIAAKLVGASVSHVTDLPEIVPNLAHNVELNKTNCVSYPLDWSDPKFPPHVTDHNFDVCSISDPVYSREHPAMLLSAVKMVAATTVLSQLPSRKGFEAERQEIWDGLPALGYHLIDRDEEQGRDLFGEQSFSYTKWTKSAQGINVHN